MTDQRITIHVDDEAVMSVNPYALQRSIRNLTFMLAIIVGLQGSFSQCAARAQSPSEAVDFNREIRPILADTCFTCHGPDAGTRQAELRLDLATEAIADRGGYQAISPGKAESSEAIRRIFSDDAAEQMPPPDAKKQLTHDQKLLLRKWVEQGAIYQEHWSFRTPQRSQPPTVQGASHAVRNEIDAFIAARLQHEGLSMSPEANRETLVRRVTFDLTGLPPTIEELDAALHDESPDWYEAVVDRLLNSPRYGERMAVEWLDAARYADTHGFHIDSHRDMWRWREWVINAFNSNMPFDQFTIEQLAGDLLPGATVEQRLATGFNRNHPINFEGGAIPEEYLTAYIVDRVNTTGTVWLGLTIGCAQCHDHKYDPISQQDYYKFYAFFNNVPEQGLDGREGNAVPVMQAPTLQQQQQISDIQSQIARLESELATRRKTAVEEFAAWEHQFRDGSALPTVLGANIAKVAEALFIAYLTTIPGPERTADQQRFIEEYFFIAVDSKSQTLQHELNDVRHRLAELEKSIPTSMVMQELEQSRDTFLLERGQYDKHRERVSAGVPAIFPAVPNGNPANRLGLAHWLVDPANPLTARVIVNRFWQIYFGTGLVKTAEDFGTQGEWPSHPELLDWLATEFLRTGWDVKAMQRLIVTSATYRQTSATTPTVHQRDPENRLLARGPRFRLSAEMIRDNALFVSGLIVEKIGGPSVLPYQPPGLWEEMAHVGDTKFTAQKYVQGHGEDLYRRSMYTFWKRTVPPASLNTFDAPDREFCIVRRLRTNTPLQALVLMNDPTYVESSRKLAERTMRLAASPTERIAVAFRLATARRPSGSEVSVLQSLFDKRFAAFSEDPAAAEQLLSVGESARDKQLNPTELAAWTAVASVILNLDETLTRR
jgi:hypothetical protein